MQNKKIKLLKILLFTIIVGICLILTIELMPFIKSISTRDGQEAFRDKIQSMGITGTLLLFTLQVCQILLAFLPGEPFEVLAGMCYGAIGGMVFIFVSVFLTTLLIFSLVRKYKERYLYNFFKKEKVQKILNSTWFSDSKKTETTLIILFFIPGIPKDILVYCGGLLDIKPIKFVLIATFARFPSVISSTLVGSNIVWGNWKNILFIYGITTILTALFLFFLNHSRKGDVDEL